MPDVTKHLADAEPFLLINWHIECRMRLAHVSVTEIFNFKLAKLGKEFIGAAAVCSLFVCTHHTSYALLLFCRFIESVSILCFEELLLLNVVSWRRQHRSFQWRFAFVADIKSIPKWLVSSRTMYVHSDLCANEKFSSMRIQVVISGRLLSHYFADIRSKQEY